MGKINFGAFVNNRQSVAQGDYYPLTRLVEAALLCEDLGYESVWVGDSPLAKPRYEPITTLAAIAMRTTRVKLATGILQPHLRNPMWLALSWATLDILSGGRTMMAAGVGDGNDAAIQRECLASGIEKRKRGTVFEETINLVRRLWVESNISYEGWNFKLEDVTLGFRPLQKPYPPILVAAGGHPRTIADPTSPLGYRWYGIEPYPGQYERIARLGEGWMSGPLVSAEEYSSAWEKIRDWTKQFKRNPDKILRAKNFFVNIGSDRDSERNNFKRSRERYTIASLHDSIIDKSIAGTADYCIKRVQSFVDLGVTIFDLVFEDDDQIGQFNKFAKEVMPSF